MPAAVEPGALDEQLAPLAALLQIEPLHPEQRRATGVGVAPLGGGAAQLRWRGIGG